MTSKQKQQYDWTMPDELIIDQRSKGVYENGDSYYNDSTRYIRADLLPIWFITLLLLINRNKQNDK